MIVSGLEGLTIRSIRTDRWVSLHSEEYSLRMVYSISLRRQKKSSFDDSEGGRRLNDPFDPYGWLSLFALRRIQFTDGILHLIRET